MDSVLSIHSALTLVVAEQVGGDERGDQALDANALVVIVREEHHAQSRRHRVKASIESVLGARDLEL